MPGGKERNGLATCQAVRYDAIATLMQQDHQLTKSRVDDLAIFGGKPSFARPLHVNRPNVGDKDLFLSKVDDAWDARWFTNDGPIARELEARLQDYLDVRHCVLANNGTAAMTMLIHALGLSGEVILPSFTFISTAHSLHWAGIKPVFCDLEPGTFNMDPAHCRELITPRTTAVIPTHVWGNACAIEEFEHLCRSNGVPLIFDSAHAFGSTHNGRRIGGFGDAEVFSFHATKAFHTCEGGAITTNDDALAARLRRIRNFGFADYDTVEMAGTNAKMSEIHAAMGLANLSQIDATFARCKAAFDIYAELLDELPGFHLTKPPAGEQSNHHYVAASVDAQKFGLSRDSLLKALHAENVLARRYFYPGSHASEPYRSVNPEAGASLPNTADANRRTIVFPAGAGITLGEVNGVCGLLKFISQHAGEIAAALEEGGAFAGTEIQ